MQDLAHQLRLEIKQLRQQLLREQQEREKDCAVYLQTTRSLRRELDNLQAEVQTERAAVASLGQAKRAAEADYNTAFGRVNALEAELELVRGCYRDLQEEVACHHQAGKAYLSALRSSHGRVRRLEESRYTVVVPGPEDVCLLPDPCCGSGG